MFRIFPGKDPGDVGVPGPKFISAFRVNILQIRAKDECDVKRPLKGIVIFNNDHDGRFSGTKRRFLIF